MKAKLLSEPSISLCADADGGYCEFDFEAQDGSVGTAAMDFPNHIPELPEVGGVVALEGDWLNAHKFRVEALA